MKHLGMLRSVSPGLATSKARLVDHVDMVAPVGGIFNAHVELGAEIRPQHRLAHITDFHGVLRAEIFAQDHGFVGALRTVVSVNPGDLVFRIFRDVSAPL